MVNHVIHTNTQIIIQLNRVSSMLESRLEKIKIPRVL